MTLLRSEEAASMEMGLLFPFHTRSPLLLSSPCSVFEGEKFIINRKGVLGFLCQVLQYFVMVFHGPSFGPSLHTAYDVMGLFLISIISTGLILGV